MTLIWIALSALVAAAGIRYVLRLRAASRGTRVDDDTIRQIMETGRVRRRDDAPLDMADAAEAEDEFWSESWDEPEEYPR